MGHNPRQYLECRKFGFDSIPVFRLALWVSKQQTEFYALHKFCRSSSQIFENDDERLELSCIASFAAQNQSMFGFTAGF